MERNYLIVAIIVLILWIELIGLGNSIYNVKEKVSKLESQQTSQYELSAKDIDKLKLLKDALKD